MCLSLILQISEGLLQVLVQLLEVSLDLGLTILDGVLQKQRNPMINEYYPLIGMHRVNSP